ncbi:MAG TPA: 23S rRNA (adenine(2503)-C2)-methyltransferase, partial [Anaerolineales bacterium]|nr:23S rRNA (adenine(2503)-C2)-methyltransferase [Anaerolineales bacterium]
MAEPDNGVSRPSILDLSFAEIGQVVADWDLPAYRARQIWHALYQRRSVEPSSLTELPVDLRHRLGEAFAFRSLHVRDRQVSEDGRATKFLLTTQTGHPVEAVQMRYDRRHTACISTQSGCGMGCTFCATGQLGFLRNLTPGEIVEQVLWLMDDGP